MTELFSEEVRQNPYPAYDELRRAASIPYSRQRKAWLIARYDDVAEVLSDQRRFSTKGTSAETTLLGADLADHARVRGIVKGAFSSTRLSNLGDAVRKLVDDLLDPVVARGKCELIADLAAPLPLTVVAWMLGIDIARRDDLRRWSAAILREGKKRPPQPGRGEIPDEVSQCRSFLADHFRRAESEPTGGWVTDWLAGCGGNERLTLAEMIDIGFLLIVAGTETTTNLIGNATLALTNGSQWQGRILAEPALIDPFIEEVLRYESPVQRRSRVAVSDTRIGDTNIPAGSRLEIFIGAANRDPKQFPNADQFIVGRKPNHHLAFGVGSHFCLGAQLARMEASAALQALSRRLPELALARPHERIDFGESFSVRGPRLLDLTFRRANA
jgi:pimeloyl-[acyl-carrier protein] synthase